MIGAAFFGVSYLMLGAIIGAILNVVAILRSVIYLLGDRVRAGNRLWLVFFGALYVLAYALTFTAFGKEASATNLIIEALPAIAMLAITIGYSLKDAAAIRTVALIASPLWLAYNIISQSIGGILCEAFSLVSVIIGIFRLDKAGRDDNGVS